MTFGDNLSANNNIYRATLNKAQLTLKFSGLSNHIGRQNSGLFIRKHMSNLFQYTLHAWTTGRQTVNFSTFFAFIGHIAYTPALMAGHDVFAPMFNQPCITIRTSITMPTISA